MSAVIQPLDRAAWRELTRRFADHNYRQLWPFGLACASRLGATSEHVALLDGTDLLGLADVRIRRAPVIGGGIAYVTGGPIVRQDGGGTSEQLRVCLDGLAAEYVAHRSLVLRILPPLGPPEWNAVQADQFVAAGYQPANTPAPYRTILVDIGRPLDQIRKSLAQKWRNCLNRSERENLRIRSGLTIDLFDEFEHLYRQLIERKQFDVDLDAGFYGRVQRELADGDHFHVSLADLDGRPVAGHVSSMLGDTCVYLLGASTEDGLRTKAAYLLQWHTVETAVARGCRWYDLGGIDPQANPGVYHFKQGFGGLDIAAPGPFERRPSGIRSRVAVSGERIYRLVQRLRRSDKK
jgi:hypothetical protein